MNLCELTVNPNFACISINGKGRKCPTLAFQSIHQFESVPRKKIHPVGFLTPFVTFGEKEMDPGIIRTGQDPHNPGGWRVRSIAFKAPAFFNGNQRDLRWLFRCLFLTKESP